MEKTSDVLKRIHSEGPLYRGAAVNKAGINKEERTVKISFSSEDPYERWFGMEILGHDAGEVDMSFMNSGSAPFLDSHNSGKQIGVIEKAWIDNDKKARAVVRFSRNPAADEIFQDITDGIRKNISVGYEVNSMVLVSDHENEGKTYRVDSWMPLEASSVSIPADRTVGVGRENSPTDHKNNRNKKMETEKKKTGLSNNAVKEILALGKHKAGNFMDMAIKAINDETPVEVFREMLLAKIDAAETVRSGIDADPNIFSHRKSNDPVTPIRNAVMAQMSGVRDSYGAGQALEWSQEYSRKTSRNPQGVFVPMGNLQSRTMVTNIGSQGGYLVEETLRPDLLIDVLRNASLVLDFGATLVQDLSGDIDIPRVNSSATAYWLGEDEAVTDSNLSLGQGRMSPKTLGARVEVSRRAVIQSALTIEQFLRNDLSKLLFR